MRLIDADNLVEFIVQNDCAFTYAIEHRDREMLEELIATIPNIYNVNKVVEELNENSVMRANSKAFYSNPQNGEYVDKL